MNPRPLEVLRRRVVPVPIDVLWPLIEPAENLPAWLPLFDRVERVGGEGLGRRQRATVRWGRRTTVIDQEVVAYEPYARLSWVHRDERVDGRPAPRISAHVETTVRLESADPGTRVSLESRHTASGRLAGLWLRLVARRRLERAFDRALTTLAGVGS